MVDAPEFAFRALNRERITDLERIFLTQWHPDHVNGLRIGPDDSHNTGGLRTDVRCVRATRALHRAETFSRQRAATNRRLIKTDGKTLVIAADDTRYLPEDDLPETIDFAVFECGLFEQGPDGTALFTESDWAFLKEELTHEIRARITRIEPETTLFTETEHLTDRSYDHFRELETKSKYDGIGFAYNGLMLDI